MYSLFMVFNASPFNLIHLDILSRWSLSLLRISSAFLEESLQGGVVSEHVNSGVGDTRMEVIDVDQET